MLLDQVKTDPVLSGQVMCGQTNRNHIKKGETIYKDQVTFGQVNKWS